MGKIVYFFLTILFITGCSIHKVEENSFDSIIKSILFQKTNVSNVNFEGYKFYLPRGTKVINKEDYNLVIKDFDNIYYLYVDTISYYYKTEKEHVIDNDIFYSNTLKNNNDFGYIDITKVDNKYFLEVMYNYAKIEAYVEEEDLYSSFINICYILATIDYNDSSIQYKLESQVFSSVGEEFDIFKSKKDSDNFLKWIEQYDKYEENEQIVDQDIIETDEN